MSRIHSLKGHLDELWSFESLAVDLKERQDLHLDVSGVLSVSAGGLKHWKAWLDGLGRPQLYLHFCTPLFFEQMNSVRGLQYLQAIVGSVEVHYVCPACSTELDYMMYRGQNFIEGTAEHRESLTLPEKVSCPSCSHPMEPDFRGQDYFSFLKYRN